MQYRAPVTILALTAALQFLWPPTDAVAQVSGSAEFAQVPPGMSFEEFEDANRTVLDGLPWAMIPGGMHFYANEPTKGWILAGTMAAGVISIIVGASMGGEGDGEVESEHEVVSFGEGDDERLFAKVPTGRTETVDSGGGVTTETQYRLDGPLALAGDGAGAPLVILGSMALVSSYVVGFFHGMHTIRLKRNRARYEAGKRAAELRVIPTVGLDGEGGGGGGLRLDLRF